MSPGRHGRTPPPSSTDRPTVAQRGGDRAGDRGGLPSPQLLGIGVVGIVLDGAQHAHRAVVATPGPGGVERAVCRLDVGLRLDDLAEHAVDPLDDGVGRAEVRRQHRPRPHRSRPRPRGTWRCRRGGTGRSTASGRRRRTGARAAGRCRRCRRATARPARRSGARRSPAGSGRCPGTRRAAAGGSGRGGAAGRPRRWPAARRASTSRSWNSSVPAAAPGHRALEHEPPADGADHELAVRAPPGELGVDDLDESGVLGLQRVALVAGGPSTGPSRRSLIDRLAILAEGLQGVERRGDVVGAGQLVGQHADGGDGLGLGVVGRRPRGGDGAGARHDAGRRAGARWGLEVDAVVDEVPVGLEVLGHPTQAGADARTGATPGAAPARRR